MTIKGPERLTAVPVGTDDWAKDVYCNYIREDLAYTRDDIKKILEAASKTRVSGLDDMHPIMAYAIREMDFDEILWRGKDEPL